MRGFARVTAYDTLRGFDSVVFLQRGGLVLLFFPLIVVGQASWLVRTILMKFDLYNWVKIDESDYQGLWAFCLCYAFDDYSILFNNKKKYKRKYRRISQILRIRNYFDFDRYIIKLTEKSRAAARREKCLESSFHLASKIDLKHEETKRSMPFLSFVQRLKSKRPPLTN